MAGEMTAQILLGKLLPTSRIVTPIEEASTMGAQSQNAAVRSIGRVGSSTLKGAATAIPYGAQAGLTTPLQAGEGYGEHMAQNVQGAVQMGAAIPGGLSLLGEGARGIKAVPDAYAGAKKLLASTHHIQLPPEILSGESVDDILNEARNSPSLKGINTIADIQKKAQIEDHKFLNLFDIRNLNNHLQETIFKLNFEVSE